LRKANVSAWQRTHEQHVDGVICPGRFAKEIRVTVGVKNIIVCPGIRSDSSRSHVASPTEAIQNGADFIVVGRPITFAPSMHCAAEKILEEIEIGSKKETT